MLQYYYCVKWKKREQLHYFSDIIHYLTKKHYGYFEQTALDSILENARICNTKYTQAFKAAQQVCVLV